MSSKIVALVPMRGGSKSIPKKNVKIIAGKPLCFYGLSALCKASFIDEIYVSSDSDEILNVAQGVNEKIIPLKRKNELAEDTTSTEDVMLDFLESVQCDLLILLQVTSPLVTSEDLEKAYMSFIAQKGDSLLTGILEKRFYWNIDGTPLNYDPVKRPRRQDFDGTVVENGAFYFSTPELLKKTKSRLHGKIVVHQMEYESKAEIDEPADWVEVERLLLQKKGNDFSNLKLFICDVDGTLTDGGMYYSENGELIKKFNTRDAKGLSLLRKNGIDVMILTSESSPCVHSRMKKLGITNYHHGIEEKLAYLKDYLSKENLKFEEIGFIGDDLNDIEVLKKVGYSFCPCDAIQKVKESTMFNLTKAGGAGAVREACDMILEKKS